MSDWNEIESRLGLKLPAVLHDFYRTPRRCNFVTPLWPTQIGGLDYLYPQVAPRVLPVFTMPSGDFLGLFFPREGGSPFLVDFQHEQSVITPLTSDLGQAFADPDRFSRDNPFSKQSVPWADDSAWSSLRIDADGANATELELLKPMSLHYRDLESNSEHLFRNLSKRFGSEDPRAKLIREHFKASPDLHDRKRWVALSDGLIRLERWRDAIQALDNCHTILFIHPHYGSGATRGDPSWKNVAVVLEKLLAIARSHGDTFDRVAMEHQLKIALQFAKKEDRGPGPL
jgi:hypothetical protein